MVSPTEQDKAMVKVAVAGLRKKLMRQCREWIAFDPSGFRAFVLGTMKATLPRQRAGRKSNATVQNANRLYEAQLQNGGVANWHAIAATVIENYTSVAPTIQQWTRKRLRAKVHSYRHSLKQTRRLSETKKQFSTPTF